MPKAQSFENDLQHTRTRLHTHRHTHTHARARKHTHTKTHERTHARAHTKCNCTHVFTHEKWKYDVPCHASFIHILYTLSSWCAQWWLQLQWNRPRFSLKTYNILRLRQSHLKTHAVRFLPICTSTKINFSSEEVALMVPTSRSPRGTTVNRYVTSATNTNKNAPTFRKSNREASKTSRWIQSQQGQWTGYNHFSRVSSWNCENLSTLVTRSQSNCTSFSKLFGLVPVSYTHLTLPTITKV